MKHKKSLMAVILVVVLLTFAVGGTIAYLMDSTGTVTNSFMPTQVDTEIREEFSGDAKTFIGVTNPLEEKSIPAYVRVVVTGNWCDADNKIVKAWEPAFGCNEDAWDRVVVDGVAYYYYKSVLNVGETTENLLDEGVTISKTSTAEGYEGLHLVVTVMQQAIQSEGMNVNNAQAAFSKAAQ